MFLQRFLFVLLLFLSSLWAGELKNLVSKVEVEGNVAVGLEYKQSIMPLAKGSKVFSEEAKRIGVLEADFTIKPTKRVFFSFDLNYDIKHPSLEVHKLYGGIRMKNAQQFRFGYMKKKLSIEGTQDERERSFGRRSLLHEYVKSFHILGHDLVFYYRKKLKGDSPLAGTKLWGGLGGDASKRFFGIFSAYIERPHMLFHAGGMYVNADDSYERLDYGLYSLGVASAFDGWYQFEIDAMGGLDPTATAMEQSFHRDTQIHFTGLRVQNSVKFPIASKGLRAIKPIVEGTYLWKDLGTRRAELQLRPGLNFYFSKKDIINLKFTGDFRFSTQLPDHDNFIHNFNSLSAEVQILW